MNNHNTLEKLLKAYYYKYYFEDLKIANWLTHFNELRINEVEFLGKKVINSIISKGINPKNKKTLVIGAGTGAEGFYLSKYYTKEITLLEPSNEAIAILQERKKLENNCQIQIVQGFAEDLPFPDNSFDFILCFTVLEHVRDVKKSLLEIHRVLNKNSNAVIITPNYAFPCEPHYKITTFPPAYFPFLVKLHLKIIKRYTPFFTTLNFYTQKNLEKIMIKNNIPYTYKNDYFDYSLIPRWLKLYLFFFNEPKNQQIYITKK